MACGLAGRELWLARLTGYLADTTKRLAGLGLTSLTRIGCD